MTDDPMDSLPSYNRVSIRAVLIQDGEDPHAALAAAGIHDPVAVPVVFGETADISGGILGDGITPNLTAVLETVHEEEFDPSLGAQPDSARSLPRSTPSATPGTRTLPAAFGMQPLAPIRRA